MTRDEAIAKYKAAVNAPDGVVWCANEGEMRDALRKMERDAGHFVDASVALGMLKLDEPVSAKSKALTALFKQFGAMDIQTVFGLLDEAGLTIVEK